MGARVSGRRGDGLVGAAAVAVGLIGLVSLMGACLRPEEADGARCDASATCPPGYYCIGHVCTAPPEPLSPCRADADCDGYVCDLSAWPDAPGIGFCVQCMTDAHCLHGRCLLGATCGCEADADCDTGLCYDPGGFCTSCKTDAQCGAGSCEDGVCVPPMSRPGDRPPEQRHGGHTPETPPPGDEGERPREPGDETSRARKSDDAARGAQEAGESP